MFPKLFYFKENILKSSKNYLKISCFALFSSLSSIRFFFSLHTSNVRNLLLYGTDIVSLPWNLIVTGVHKGIIYIYIYIIYMNKK